MKILIRTLLASSFLAACGLPDISHLSPAEQLKQLSEFETEINEGVAKAAAIGPAPWGQTSTDLALKELANAQTQGLLTEIKQKRSAIIAANPELASVAAASQSAGSGADLASVDVGHKVAAVRLNGQCGLPAKAVSESNRRAWYNETLKGSQPNPFRTNASARSEIMSIATPPGFSSLCEAFSKQVYEFVPSLNHAIKASNELHNGQGVGLGCGASGASGSSACTATNIVYGLKTISFMCHQVCDENSNFTQPSQAKPLEKPSGCNNPIQTPSGKTVC